jgi:hypothetical protein
MREFVCFAIAPLDKNPTLMVRDGLRPPHHEVTPHPEEPPTGGVSKDVKRQAQANGVQLYAARVA